MKAYKFLLLLFPFCANASLSSLYATLDPTSVTQHFAFYELYPATAEGKQALAHAWELLSGSCAECDPQIVFPAIDVQPIIALFHRSPQEETPILSPSQLAVIDKLSSHLGNRSLQGFHEENPEHLLTLVPEEIDLARGLLLFELGPLEMGKIQSYEALLDLMALQIAARLPVNATQKQKVVAINDYIFSEMQFRFPPHSLHAKDIDAYTLLPFVLDSRKGVCLGVSILYLSLAQRLRLSLESVTPPGHIYVRHVAEDGEVINIETTARGINLPSEIFLGLETKSLQTRNIRQVIGLAFMNQAAVSWHRDEPLKAIELYETAQKFLGSDYLLNLFLGINYLIVGRDAEGKALLEKVRGVIPDHAIRPDTLSEDFLLGLADIQAIQAVFSEVDATRGSILRKRQKLEDVVARFPKFRQGILHLAITYLQLGREKEALPLLERCSLLDPQDPTVHYYLAAIHMQRHNYPESWQHLRAATSALEISQYKPYALEQLRKSLQRAHPEPL